jgi:hypothetical protein
MKYDTTIGTTYHKYKRTLHLEFKFVSWFWQISARIGRTGYFVGVADLAALRSNLYKAMRHSNLRQNTKTKDTSHHGTLYISVLVHSGRGNWWHTAYAFKARQEIIFPNMWKIKSFLKANKTSMTPYTSLSSYLYIKMKKLLYLFF